MDKLFCPICGSKLKAYKNELKSCNDKCSKIFKKTCKNKVTIISTVKQKQKVLESFGN
jgi:hypothetical protein